ncbi:MAG: hypothetical protein ACTSXQ_06380 [Alphaproteobacteria bacterium]
MPRSFVASGQRQGAAASPAPPQSAGASSASSPSSSPPPPTSWRAPPVASLETVPQGFKQSPSTGAWRKTPTQINAENKADARIRAEIRQEIHAQYKREVSDRFKKNPIKEDMKKDAAPFMDPHHDDPDAVKPLYTDEEILALVFTILAGASPITSALHDGLKTAYQEYQEKGSFSDIDYGEVAQSAVKGGLANWGGARAAKFVYGRVTKFLASAIVGQIIGQALDSVFSKLEENGIPSKEVGVKVMREIRDLIRDEAENFMGLNQ